MSEGFDCYCVTCKKTFDASNFYTSRNLEKYPNGGKLNECKKCITRHVDNWNPDTYVWIIEELDIPYVPDEWNSLLMTYGKDPARVKGTTIIGRYISKMRLNQYNKYRFKDSEYVVKVLQNKKETTLLAAGYSQDEVNDILKADSVIAEPPEGYKEYMAQKMGISTEKQPEESEYDYFGVNSQEDEIAESLTDEDKTRLRLKWGVSYKPYEWVQLEQLWEDMMRSYDIQSAGHKDTLKLICKTSLKANQLLDLGDVDGYQKMARVYDTLMKSGNFTALQNKESDSGDINSIAELVELCESKGFIPKYYVDEPKDKVDETLIDIKRYIKTLIYEETNLGSLIEQAIKDIQAEAETEKQTEEELNLTYDEEDIDINEFEAYYARNEEFDEMQKREKDLDIENETSQAESAAPDE